MNTVLLVLSLLSFAPNAYAQETKWVAEDAATSRFLETPEPAGPAVTAGAKVVVLFQESGKVRIQANGAYGWVSADKLTDTAPANAVQAAPSLDFGLGQGLNLPPGMKVELGGAGAGN
jgi:hypothetical protein